MAKRNGKPTNRHGPKSPRKTSPKKAANGAVLVAYPKSNGGMLQVGNPGNAGGTGRPRSAIRDRAAALYDEHGMTFLENVLRGEKIDVDVVDMFGNLHEMQRRATVKERQEAAKQLGMIGLGEHKELTVDDVRNRLGRTLGSLRKRLTAETLVEAVQQGKAHQVIDWVLNDLRPIWAA